MFGTDDRDLIRSLGEMANIAHQRANANQVEAKQTLAAWISQDRRFDFFDASRLAERVGQCRSNGAQLDLTDPQLRGLPSRPLDSKW